MESVEQLEQARELVGKVVRRMVKVSYRSLCFSMDVSGEADYSGIGQHFHACAWRGS